MPVEATTYSIVYWNSPYFYNYFEYEHKFETIQEALSYSPTEFNWWEQQGFIQWLYMMSSSNGSKSSLQITNPIPHAHEFIANLQVGFDQ